MAHSTVSQLISLFSIAPYVSEFYKNTRPAGLFSLSRKKMRERVEQTTLSLNQSDWTVPRDYSHFPHGLELGDLDRLHSAAQLTERLNMMLKGTGDIRTAQRFIKNLDKKFEYGVSFIPGFSNCYADCIVYDAAGVELVPGGRHIRPEPDEVVVLVTALSVCGTDRGELKKAFSGKLAPEQIGLTVGHEMAGIVVAKGHYVDDVMSCKIGDIVNAESHYPGIYHNDLASSYYDGSDGIYSLRGAGVDKTNNTRMRPKHGFFSRLAVLNRKSIMKVIPTDIAERAVSPSMYESLGNPKEITLKLKEMGIKRGATLFVIGEGATGRPLSAFATSDGYKVIGIEPDETYRQLSDNRQVCERIYSNVQEAITREIPILEKAGVKDVVVSVMSGDQRALNEGMRLLRSVNVGEQGRRVLVVFGLFNDPNAKMPFVSIDVSQNSFVFDRMTDRTEDGIEITGVCGRRWETWDEMLKDFQRDPQLLRTQNEGIALVGGRDPFLSLYHILKRGEEGIQERLRSEKKVKLAANFFDRRTVFHYGWTEQKWLDSMNNLN